MGIAWKPRRFSCCLALDGFICAGADEDGGGSGGLLLAGPGMGFRGMTLDLAGLLNLSWSRSPGLRPGRAV